MLFGECWRHTDLYKCWWVLTSSLISPLPSFVLYKNVSVSLFCSSFSAFRVSACDVHPSVLYDTRLMWRMTVAWEKQVSEGFPWGTRWQNRLAGRVRPLFPGRGKQAKQITSQLLRLAWVLLSVCRCMALSGWGPSCRDSPIEKKRRNKPLEFSIVHPSGDGDWNRGFYAGLVLADGRRRDGRQTTKKMTVLEVSPLLSRLPVILALGHG